MDMSQENVGDAQRDAEEKEGKWESKELWQLPFCNPHCMQVVLNQKELRYEQQINPEFRRILDPGAPQLEYQSQPKFKKTVLHWGQRKLLLSEIEFLTLIDRKDLENATVVYAGAAPSSHTPFLSKLFPTVEFILVDPAKFTRELSRRRMEDRGLKLETTQYPRIKVIQGYFTNELATALAARLEGRNIFFVSDIRRDAYSEVEIAKDMQYQSDWHKILGSKRSMLKFRLPWTQPGSTRYLAGDIYLPVWGPQTTTESRLITDKDDPLKERDYDHNMYNDQMFHFRCYTRPAVYNHDIQGVPGLDHCYDCRAEVHILQEYINKFAPLHSVATIANNITSEIPGSRSLQVQQTGEEEEETDGAWSEDTPFTARSGEGNPGFARNESSATTHGGSWLLM